MLTLMILILVYDKSLLIILITLVATDAHHNTNDITKTNTKTISIPMILLTSMSTI